MVSVIIICHVTISNSYMSREKDGEGGGGEGSCEAEC